VAPGRIGAGPAGIHEIAMTRYTFVLTIALALALFAGAARADSDLSMQDLLALDRQKQWTELLDAADRVKPAARTADWTRLVTSAATHVAEQIERAGTSGLHQAGSLFAVVPAAERKYAFLVGDAGYLGAKARALQGVVTACQHDALAGCGGVVAALADGITQFPPGIAKAIALMVAGDIAPADSVHFWALAVDDDKDTCKHGQLGRSVVRALRDASAPRQVADAQRAAAACYATLEQALIDELVATKDDAKQRPLYLTNACPVLKTHGAMTIAKKKKCP
jgi:hypothetical protein